MTMEDTGSEYYSGDDIEKLTNGVGKWKRSVGPTDDYYTIYFVQIIWTISLFSASLQCITVYNKLCASSGWSCCVDVFLNFLFYFIL